MHMKACPLKYLTSQGTLHMRESFHASMSSLELLTYTIVNCLYHMIALTSLIWYTPSPQTIERLAGTLNCVLGFGSSALSVKPTIAMRSATMYDVAIRVVLLVACCSLGGHHVRFQYQCFSKCIRHLIRRAL